MDNKPTPIISPEDQTRISRYGRNDQLFDGEHFKAFKENMGLAQLDPQVIQAHESLKYVTSNMAALISKVSADLLFSEPLIFRYEDKNLEKWMEDLSFTNEIHTQLYESALVASRRGDTVFKLRAEDDEVIIEEISASHYFPRVNKNNVRQKPQEVVIQWEVTVNGKKLVRREIHVPGMIEQQVWESKDSQLGAKLPLEQYFPNLEEIQETGVDRILVFHVPNFRKGGSFWGEDDYKGLEGLFRAINNRLTKNENVLDKHTDPILAIPEGVLDEKGQVKRDKLGVFVLEERDMGGATAKPEYITWNANLEASFKQLDKLVEHLFMTSEISPNALGMGDAIAESGRALRIRLMRTLSKVKRKRLYYDQALKDLLYTAALFAQANSLTALGNRFPVNTLPDRPNIEWQDGLPHDDDEVITNETAKLDAGLQTKAGAISNIENISLEDAQVKADKIKEETSTAVPVASTDLFGRATVGSSGDDLDDEE